MVDRSTHLDPFGLPLLQHALEYVGFDPEGDVQIQRILAFELERRVRRLEKSEAGAVIHLEKGMECAPLIDLERADQPKSEEILVKGSGLLRIPAAIGI